MDQLGGTVCNDPLTLREEVLQGALNKELEGLYPQALLTGPGNALSANYLRES